MNPATVIAVAWVALAPADLVGHVENSHHIDLPGAVQPASYRQQKPQSTCYLEDRDGKVIGYTSRCETKQ